MKETILLTKTFIKNGFRSGEKGKTKIGLYIAICIYFSVFTLYISFNAMNVLKNEFQAFRKDYAYWSFGNTFRRKGQIIDMSAWWS